MATGRTTKTVAAGGAEISYDIRSGGTPNVVLIHGWACRKGYWDGVIDALGRPGTFVALDLAGHGDSTAGPGPWTVERYADDVLTVLDAEGLSDAILVGHSMGAAIALEAARKARDKVRSVVAVDGLSHLGTYRANPAEAVAAHMGQMKIDFPQRVAAMMRPLFRSEPKGGVAEKVVTEMASVDPAVGLPAMESTLLWDMDEVLAATDVPVTILAARNIMPKEAPDELGHRCDVRPLDLEGHFFCIEQPKETAGQLRPLIGT